MAPKIPDQILPATETAMQQVKLNISAPEIESFCQKWKITELSFFGSVLRSDFRPDSDLDVLVDFSVDTPWTLLDLVTMQQELENIVQRDVDLIEKRVIEKSKNWIRRNEILNTAQVIYP